MAATKPQTRRGTPDTRVQRGAIAIEVWPKSIGQLVKLSCPVSGNFSSVDHISPANLANKLCVKRESGDRSSAGLNNPTPIGPEICLTLSSGCANVSN